MNHFELLKVSEDREDRSMQVRMIDHLKERIPYMEIFENQNLAIIVQKKGKR